MLKSRKVCTGLFSEIFLAGYIKSLNLSHQEKFQRCLTVRKLLITAFRYSKMASGGGEEQDETFDLQVLNKSIDELSICGKKVT